MIVVCNHYILYYPGGMCIYSYQHARSTASIAQNMHGLQQI